MTTDELQDDSTNLCDEAQQHPLFWAQLSPSQQRIIKAMRRYWETASTASLQTLLGLYDAEP